MVDKLIEENLRLQENVIELENLIRLHHYEHEMSIKCPILADYNLWNSVDNGIICSNDTANAIKKKHEAAKADSDKA